MCVIAATFPAAGSHGLDPAASDATPFASPSLRFQPQVTIVSGTRCFLEWRELDRHSNLAPPGHGRSAGVAISHARCRPVIYRERQEDKMRRSEARHHDEWYSSDAEAMFSRPIHRATRERRAQILGAYIQSLATRPSLLSLGSGDGSLEASLANGCQRIVGIELSAVGVTKARHSAANLDHVDYLQGDIRQLSELVESETFDVILAAGTLHHLALGDIRKVLASSARHLNIGGLFLSVDPSRQRIVRLLKPFVAGKLERHCSPDEQELDPAWMVDAAANAGLRQKDLVWIDFAAGPLGWVWPSLPARLVPAVLRVDNAALRILALRRFASSFLFVGCKEQS